MRWRITDIQKSKSKTKKRSINSRKFKNFNEFFSYLIVLIVGHRPYAPSLKRPYIGYLNFSLMWISSYLSLYRTLYCSKTGGYLLLITLNFVMKSEFRCRDHDKIWSYLHRITPVLVLWKDIRQVKSTFDYREFSLYIAGRTYLINGKS